MHLSTYVGLAVFIGSSNAFRQGFNALVRKADQSCKTQADWEADFKKLRSLPGNFDSLRLLTSLDCDAINAIAPAAIATGSKVVASISVQLFELFVIEKKLLLQAVTNHGSEWLAGVSVGDDQLCKSAIYADSLAQKIYDVRGMLSTVTDNKNNVPVGHIDCWTSWVDKENAPVIKASDFIGTSLDLYLNNSDIISIKDSERAYFDSLDKVKESVAATGSNPPIWITEGLWSSIRYPVYEVVPTIESAQASWKNIACPLFQKYNVFWKSPQDPESPAFGVLDAEDKPLFDLTC